MSILQVLAWQQLVCARSVSKTENWTILAKNETQFNKALIDNADTRLVVVYEEADACAHHTTACALVWFQLV